MLMIVLVLIMLSLLGPMRSGMELKRRHPGPSGYVLKATLLSNGTASISSLVQRKGFFPQLMLSEAQSSNLFSGSGKTSILMALLGMK